MRKIKNDGVQILGIVLSMIAMTCIFQPIIKMIFGKVETFKFLGLISEGIPSLIAWIIIFVIGIILISITKPLKNN